MLTKRKLSTGRTNQLGVLQDGLEDDDQRAPHLGSDSSWGRVSRDAADERGLYPTTGLVIG